MMIKKIVLTSVICAASIHTAFAVSTPYIGVSAGERTNTATNVNYRGMPGNLFVGYGANLGQDVYFGGEVFFSFASASIQNNGLQSTYGYGASVLPGIMINDRTMSYLRLGLVRTRFSPAGFSNNTIAGGQFGLGMQASLMQSWDLRGEYTYTSYGSLSGVSGSPRSDDFTLGLVYKLD